MVRSCCLILGWLLISIRAEWYQRVRVYTLCTGLPNAGGRDSNPSYSDNDLALSFNCLACLLLLLLLANLRGRV
jgi:hypothetical protein